MRPIPANVPATPPTEARRSRRAGEPSTRSRIPPMTRRPRSPPLARRSRAATSPMSSVNALRPGDRRRAVRPLDDQAELTEPPRPPPSPARARLRSAARPGRPSSSSTAAPIIATCCCWSPRRVWVDQRVHRRLGDRRHRALRLAGQAVLLHRPVPRVIQSGATDRRGAISARSAPCALGTVRRGNERLQAPALPRALPAPRAASAASADRRSPRSSSAAS
jgi:hypothetical protein